MFRFRKQAQRYDSSRKKSAGGNSLEAKRDGITERKVMEGANRELFQYDQPSQELGMSDLIKNHEIGTRFMYAAVTGRESEPIESRLRRLISFQPALRKKAIPIDNLPTIKLFKETEIFPLDQIIPKKQKNDGLGEYLRISDAVTIYGAVVSPDCNFTKVQVGISDNRLLTNRLVKSFIATTNMLSKGNLSLPYCVPVEDADQLVLTISRERSFLEEGRQWGAIQIQLILEFTAFPMQYDNMPVAAVNMLPSTALETPVNNPNNVDVSILNQDRNKLQSMFLDGDLADENEPIENKIEAVKYAKSSISSAQKGRKIESATPEWSFMSDKRLRGVDIDQNSIDPIEDGFERTSNHSNDLTSFQQTSEAPFASHNVEIHEEIRPSTPPLKSAMKSAKQTRFNDIDKLTPF